MSINQQAFLELIDRYLSGTATESEKLLVEETFLQMSRDRPVPIGQDQEEAIKNALFERTLQQISTRSETPAMPLRRPFYSFRLFKLAAAVLLLFALSATGWLFLEKTAKNPITPQPAQKIVRNDPAPGRQGAVLTLADGTAIVLDSAGSGVLSRQQGAEVIKDGAGITYQARSAGGAIAYNTMTTPVGRQYQLSLSDGSKIWLNAGSSITFPTAFSGKERKVSITGEAYFEVAKNKRMPFTVSLSDGGAVQVLGTHFNINSYGNEPETQTTLLEGSVKLISSGFTVTIKPGQQALSVKGKSGISLRPVDTDEVMAWKDGFFQFDHADLRYLLRQLARWYDLDIVFEGNPDSRMLGGRINRNLPLSAVLKALEAKEIRYRLEGKKLIVL